MSFSPPARKGHKFLTERRASDLCYHCYHTTHTIQFSYPHASQQVSRYAANPPILLQSLLAFHSIRDAQTGVIRSFPSHGHVYGAITFCTMPPFEHSHVMVYSYICSMDPITFSSSYCNYLMCNTCIPGPSCSISTHTYISAVPGSPPRCG